jgi:hypothetical protein
MSIFDKFFTKFAYKFDKGYPDMNNDQDVLLLESLISEVIGERYSLEEGAADVKIRQELIDKNPGFFDTQSDSRRIANKNKISADEFVKIVKNRCFGNYKKLINTLEWLDDKNLNMDIAEKLIFTEFKKYILQYN